MANGCYFCPWMFSQILTFINGIQSKIEENQQERQQQLERMKQSFDNLLASFQQLEASNQDLKEKIATLTAAQEREGVIFQAIRRALPPPQNRGSLGSFKEPLLPPGGKRKRKSPALAASQAPSSLSAPKENRPLISQLSLLLLDDVYVKEENGEFKKQHFAWIDRNSRMIVFKDRSTALKECVYPCHLPCSFSCMKKNGENQFLYVQLIGTEIREGRFFATVKTEAEEEKEMEIEAGLESLIPVTGYEKEEFFEKNGEGYSLKEITDRDF